MKSGYTPKTPFGIASIHKTISGSNAGTKPMPILYHYTSMSVMDSLLTNSQFWASNIYYLNDAEEYYKGISYLLDLFSSNKAVDNQKKKEVLQELLEDNGYSFEGVFSLSFSTQSDNLHQWITYAKEGGVCIGLDNNRLKEYMILLDGAKDEYAERVKVSDVITKARYVSKVKPQKAKDEIDNIDSMFINALKAGKESQDKDRIEQEYKSGKLTDKTKSRLKDYFRLYVSYFKNDAFKIEDEYRGVFYPLFIKHAEPPTVFYHVTPVGIVRPYIKVGFRESSMEPDVDGISPLPVRSITIGPAGNQQAVFDSVVHRVKYGTLKVWNYYDHRENDEFKNRFIEYVCGALEEYASKNATKVNQKTVKEVFDGLLEDWICETTMDPEKDLGDYSSIDHMPTCEECWNMCEEKGITDADNTKRIVAAEVLRYIRKNNYFSKEGIWVKKSQIPYVF